jgi:hypothetical protein
MDETLMAVFSTQVPLPVITLRIDRHVRRAGPVGIGTTKYIDTSKMTELGNDAISH